MKRFLGFVALLWAASLAAHGQNTYRYEGDVRYTGDILSMKTLRGTSLVVTVWGSFGSYMLPGRQTTAQLNALGLSSTQAGALSYNTTDSTLVFWNGTAWVPLGGGLTASQETCEEFATAWDTTTATRTGATNAAVTLSGTPVAGTTPKWYRAGILMPDASRVLSNSNRTATFNSGYQPVFDEVVKGCYWKQ